jgi:hypothetical protein
LIISDSGFTGGLNLFQNGANPIRLWTNGSEQMRIDSAGNVGIGTTTPVGKLDARGSVKIGPSGSGAFPAGTLLYLDDFVSGGTARNITWNLVTTNTDSAQISALREGASYATSLIFKTANSADAFSTERMRINSSGNAGIGTASPSWRVTAYGAAAADVAAQDATGAMVMTVASGTGYLTTNTSNPIIIRTNSVERMRIESTGAVVLPKLTLSTDTPFLTGANINSGANPLAIGTTSTGVVALFTNNTERLRVKTNGQVRFIPLAAAPGSPEAGDVYYDSTTNKLRCYNGTTWNDLF